MGWEIDTLRSFDGELIRFGLYGDRNSRGKTIVFLNGRGEWIEKYGTIAKDLGFDASTTILTIDHRGQGGSGGVRGHIEDYSVYSQDLSLVIREVLGQSAEFDLVAHSMGGLIGMHATLNQWIRPQRIYLSAPFFGFRQALAFNGVARKVVSLLASSRFDETNIGQGEPMDESGFLDNPYTSDEGRYKAIVNSPYKLPLPTIGWINSTLKAQSAILKPELLPRLKVAMKIVCAEKEEVVYSPAITSFILKARQVAGVSITCKVISDAKHELLAERSEILDQVRVFFKVPDAH